MSVAIHAAAAAGTLGALAAAGALSALDLRDHMPLLVRHAVAAPTATPAAQAQPLLVALLQHTGAAECLEILAQSFDAIAADVAAAEKTRDKARAAEESSAPASFVQLEQADVRTRMVLVLAEIGRLHDEIRAARRGGREVRCTSALFDPENAPDFVLPYLCFAVSELSDHASMAVVLDVLLHVRGGEALALRVVLNFPELQSLVLAALLRHAATRASWLAEAAAGLLQSLATRLPAWAARIRAMLSQAQLLPTLFLQLLAEAPDLVPSLNGLVRADAPLAFLSGALAGTSAPARTAAATVRRRLLDAAQATAAAAAATVDLAGGCALLCVGTVLAAAVHSAPPPTEPDAWLALATAAPGMACPRFVKLALCYVLVSPGAALAPDRVVPWLQRLAALSLVRAGSDSHAELLLLLAIHAHAARHGAIAQLVRQVLAAKIDVPLERIKRAADTLLRPAFPEAALVKQALAAPATTGLHAAMHDFLPIHCVAHLLESRAFVRYQMDLRPWLLWQLRLCSATQPVHPTLVDALKSYAGFSVSPLGSWVGSGDAAAKDLAAQLRGCAALAPFAAADLQQLLDTGHEVTRALVLFHVVSLLHSRRAWLERAATQQPAVAALVPPPPAAAFVDALPVRAILQAMQARGSPARSLYPTLLPLVSALMPHHLLPSGLLRQQGQVELQSSTVGSATRWLRVRAPTLAGIANPPLLPGPAAAVLSDPLAASEAVLAVLDTLLVLPPDELRTHVVGLVDGLLPRLARPAVHPSIRRQFRTLWLSLHAAMPSDLLPRTLQRMGGPALTHAQLASDPLAVLRLPRAVLAVPELLEIALVILENYTYVSRAALAEQASAGGQRGGEAAADRALLMHAVMQAQEAAAIQLLVELCLPLPATGPGQTASTLPTVDSDVCVLVCRYIHAAFVASPSLVHAVHSVGYPAAALPVLVAGVPSMHVCLDFLPALIEADDPALQAFAVCLAGELAQAYPVPKALVAARAAIGRLHAASYLDSPARTRFFSSALPALTQLCTAFPPLSDAATALLVKLRNIETARVAATGAVVVRGGGGGVSGGGSEGEDMQVLLDRVFMEVVDKAILGNALFL